MILVTGGTGFLGGHLLFKLLKNNALVRAIYRKEEKLKIVKRIFSYYTDDVEALFSKIEWIKSTLNDIPALEEAFREVTQVYHCAAFVSFEPNKFELLRKTNIEGTANIVNLCLSHQVKKLCYVSTVAAIGEAKKNQKIREATTWDTEANNNVYGITKYGAELEVWRGTQEGLNAVIVNPGVILGPGIWHYGSGSIFKRINKGLTYFPTGGMGYVGVNDVVNAMFQLMNSEIINERFILVAENRSYKSLIFNIAAELNVTPPQKEATSSLLSIAWRLDWLKTFFTGKRRILSKNLARTLSEHSVYDASKIGSALGFNFTPLETVIKETAENFLKAQK